MGSTRVMGRSGNIWAAGSDAYPKTTIARIINTEILLDMASPPRRNFTSSVQTATEIHHGDVFSVLVEIRIQGSLPGSG
jgi:hypothetical protein